MVDINYKNFNNPAMPTATMLVIIGVILYVVAIFLPKKIDTQTYKKKTTGMAYALGILGTIFSLIAIVLFIKIEHN